MARAIEYFPGVPTWFARMNAYVKKRSRGQVKLQHYLISAGQREILDGVSIRVPTPNVSLVDLVVRLEKAADAKAVNAALQAAADGPLKGILAISHEPLVSCDYNGNKMSSTVDAALTTVMGNTAKVMSWNDNEMGYSQRLFDLARYVGERL